MNIPDILDAAADEIERNGHIKGELGHPDGPKCMGGALMHVSPRNLTGADEAMYAVVDYLELKDTTYFDSELSSMFDVRWCTGVDWNNAEEREPFEVVNAMRHTAKILRDME